MIPSVQERKKSVHVFGHSYPHLCRLHNTIPNPNIKIDGSNKTLDFVGDRLKFEDWKPLLEAVSNDRSLHFISVRSRHVEAKVTEESDTEAQVRQNITPKSSLLFTNYILTRLTESLSTCLRNSLTITGLVLEKIPLNLNALMLLSEGLEVCQTLQQLSLAYAQIGDDECSGLCHVLRHRLNLVWLNLTGCNLTDKGVEMLCNLLKFQKLNRYGESWKQSLRCRPVNPNIMPGLRRLTLNHNPIGDAGVKIFVDTLFDDLWLKALDLQQCGVTMVGAEALLGLVKENRFLSVVDVRGNSQVPNSLVAAIVQQLAENNRETTPEFQWLKEENAKVKGRSNSGTTISRCTQRLLSNTTIASKAMTSVLPSKVKLAPSVVLPTRTRSASAKRTHTINNSPRPPWNWNLSNHQLKRGNSDQLIRTNVKSNEDVLGELRSVKEQLHEVSQQLEEEKQRRIKIEEELEKYKSLLPEERKSPSKFTLQSMWSQLYNDHLSKEKLKSSNLDSKENEEEASAPVKKCDSLESVIRTVNRENHPCVEVSVNNCYLSNNHPFDNGSDIREAPSKAQLLFESLISS